MHTGNRRRPEIGSIDMEVGIFKTAKGNVIKQFCGFSVAKEPAPPLVLHLRHEEPDREPALPGSGPPPLA
ncbi:MAG: hypothetical protein ABFE07_01780 [Armatimonadia bacterium]